MAYFIASDWYSPGNLRERYLLLQRSTPAALSKHTVICMWTFLLGAIMWNSSFALWRTFAAVSLGPGRTSRDVRQHMNLSKRRKTICHISGMGPYGMLVAWLLVKMSNAKPGERCCHSSNSKCWNIEKWHYTAGSINTYNENHVDIYRWEGIKKLLWMTYRRRCQIFVSNVVPYALDLPMWTDNIFRLEWFLFHCPNVNIEKKRLRTPENFFWPDEASTRLCTAGTS